MIKVVLENFANFPIKHLSCSIFLVKLQAFRSETFTSFKNKKRLQDTTYSHCEIWGIFKNPYFEEYLSKTASVDN